MTIRTVYAYVRLHPWQLAIWCMVAIGVGIRLMVYAQGRSLFIDEASLGLNLCERTPGQWLQPLDYRQFAPPLWVLLQLVVVQVAGCSDYALRLLPLLSGLLSLPLFYWVLRRYIPVGPVMLLALFKFAVVDFFIQYSTELKQYSTDVVVALLLVWLATRPGLARSIKVVAGVVLVWLSMPAVFVLAAWFVQDIWLAIAHKDKKRWLGLWVWLPVGLSFGAYYLLLLQASTRLDFLQEFHASYYFPLPTDWATLVRAGELLLQLPEHTSGHTFVQLLAGSIGLMAGLWVAVRHGAGSYILLWVPAVFAYGASALGQYSLLPRMLLWLFALLMLLQAIGWQWLASRWPRIRLVVILAPLLCLAAAYYGWQVYRLPLQIEELKPLLSSLEAHHKVGEPVVVVHDAGSTFRFYYEYNGLPALPKGTPVYMLDWDPEINKPLVLPHLPSGTRYWLVQSHIPNDKEALNMHMRDFRFLPAQSIELARYEHKAAMIRYLQKK